MRAFILLMTSVLLFVACDSPVDDTTLHIIPDIETTTNTQVEALFFGNNAHNDKPYSTFSSRSLAVTSYYTPYVDKLYREKLNNSDAKMTIVPAEVNSNNVFSRIIILTVDNQVKSAVLNMHYTQRVKQDRFTGKIIITRLDGTFIRGFRFEEGLAVMQLKTPKSKASFSFGFITSFLLPQQDECPYEDQSLCWELEEVTVTAPSTSADMPIYELFDFDLLDGNGGSGGPGNDAGGGAGWGLEHNDNDEDDDGDCEPNEVKDAEGNCVKKPCKGDPVPNPEIAPQTNSGTQGGMYGCTRNGSGCVGEPTKKYHGGIDLKANYGDPTYAMYDGFVYSTGFDDEAGYMVLLQSTVGGETIIQEYFHLQNENRIQLNTDGTLNYVKAGDIIGYLGDSGNLRGAISSGLAESHVHIKIKEHDGTNNWDYDNNFNKVNPRDYLNTSINDNGTVNETNNNCN